MTPKIEDVHPRRPPWLPVACAVGVVLLGLIVVYERSGVPGPYSAGIWSTWESAQPGGRPAEANSPVSKGHSRPC